MTQEVLSDSWGEESQQSQRGGRRKSILIVAEAAGCEEAYLWEAKSSALLCLLLLSCYTSCLLWLQGGTKLSSPNIHSWESVGFPHPQNKVLEQHISQIPHIPTPWLHWTSFSFWCVYCCVFSRFCQHHFLSGSTLLLFLHLFFRFLFKRCISREAWVCLLCIFIALCIFLSRYPSFISHQFC